MKDPAARIQAKDLSYRRAIEHDRLAVSRRGMVSAAHSSAARAGAEILEAGGNAFDAAAAAAFALGVCEPAASGLGGQTAVMFYERSSRRLVALDGSSRAPNRTLLGPLPKRARLKGYRATTVPSTPAALDYLRRRYGRLKLRQVLAPAIRLAEEGYRISPLQHALTKRELRWLRMETAGRLFLRKGWDPYPVGTLFKQPALARTLRQLASKGIKDFYRGDIARRIHLDMERRGGLIRLDDLAQIPRPIEREPLIGRWGGLRIATFPPPGAGRMLIEIMKVYRRLPAKWQDPSTPEGAVALAEVIRKAFEDRDDLPRDPNRFHQLRREKMIRSDYARKVARRIRTRLSDGPLRGETTHLSVMDAEGNAVALTQSIERVYGSCAATPELGFLYNNYMSAFESEDPAHPYSLRPNAVPWASVAPTIVLRGSRAWLAIGSPGSERIAPSIFQVLLRLGREPAYDAVAAPRLHCAADGVVSIEAEGPRDRIARALRRKGYKIDLRERYSFYLGCVQLVMRKGKDLVGVADPRRDGGAAAPRTLPAADGTGR